MKNQEGSILNNHFLNLMIVRPQASKRKGRTIRDRAKDRVPEFDEAKHRVLVNDIPVGNEKLGEPVGPIDVVTVEKKHHEDENGKGQG
jgi:hypothetical protein